MFLLLLLSFLPIWCLLLFLVVPFKYPLFIYTDSGWPGVCEELGLSVVSTVPVCSLNQARGLNQPHPQASRTIIPPYSHTTKITYFINNTTSYGIVHHSLFDSSNKEAYLLRLTPPWQNSYIDWTMESSYRQEHYILPYYSKFSSSSTINTSHK